MSTKKRNWAYIRIIWGDNTDAFHEKIYQGCLRGWQDSLEND